MLILRSPVAVGMRLAPRAVAAARSHQDYQGADQQHQRPTYRLYEVQNGNHIETYKDTFPQLEVIQPHAQNAFDLLVKYIEHGASSPTQPGHCVDLFVGP
jgi:hypothetical protein